MSQAYFDLLAQGRAEIRAAIEAEEEQQRAEKRRVDRIATVQAAAINACLKRDVPAALLPYVTLPVCDIHTLRRTVAIIPPQSWPIMVTVQLSEPIPGGWSAVLIGHGNKPTIDVVPSESESWTAPSWAWAVATARDQWQLTGKEVSPQG